MADRDSGNILIVESSEPLRGLLTTLLTDKGFSITPARSAEEAASLLGQKNYEMVIADVSLPKMSGPELLINVRNSWPDTVVVLIGDASTDHHTVVESIRVGAEAFITLPFNPDEFELTIEKALEHRKLRLEVKALRSKTNERGLLDRISHEFKSPIVAIRSNANLLQRRFNELPREFIKNKLADILTDCEILLFQAGQLEYVLGRTPPVSKIEETVIFRDIIVKTINQLKPLISERGFSASNVHYNREDVPKLRLYVHKVRMTQVVYNLLINSIKYAEDDPSQFQVQIALLETDKNFIIEFRDWGIGVTTGDEYKIFEEGFRTPEAARKSATGSGLGLAIAREVMKEHGGDLILSHNYKPTVFQMILPKSLKELPHDSHR